MIYVSVILAKSEIIHQLRVVIHQFSFATLLPKMWRSWESSAATTRVELQSFHPGRQPGVG